MKPHKPSMGSITEIPAPLSGARSDIAWALFLQQRILCNRPRRAGRYDFWNTPSMPGPGYWPSRREKDKQYGLSRKSHFPEKSGITGRPTVRRRSNTPRCRTNGYNCGCYAPDG